MLKNAKKYVLGSFDNKYIFLFPWLIFLKKIKVSVLLITCSIKQ